jgi:signal peptidase I
MTAKTPKPAERHPWRENLETASIAIVMALVLKYFTLEAFQIPTGSMQPTLMGLDTGRVSDGPSSGGVRVFDRILVDKLLPFFRDPKRWEVWVFIYPLDRSERYIKRVVGLPGEELKVAFGDIFVRSSSREEWRIVRKPPKVQAHLWRQVWSSENGKPGDFWDLSGFQERGRAIAASGKASASTRRNIIDGYVDGYPPSLQRALLESGRITHDPTPVRDLRLRLEVRPKSEHRSLTLGLGWAADSLRAVISGPSGDGKARLLLNDRLLAEVPARLDHSTLTEVEFFRADEAMELSLDGKRLARVEFESSPVVGESHRPSIETDGAIEIEALAVDRDIHYTNRIGGAAGNEFHSVDIPEGHYFMMGDNSIESADGRAWMGISLELATPIDGRRRLFGGTSTSGAFSQRNPRETRFGKIFRDEFGEEYRYSQGTPGSPVPRPFVPRDYFLGRAFFVFWPFPPFAPAFRIGVVR